MKPNLICITKWKLLFKREREREWYREERDWWNPVYTNLCCVFLFCFMLLSLSVPLFFVLSMSLLCVYLLSFSVSAFFFFSSPSSLFFYLCVPLSIYREIPKKLFLALLLTDQIMKYFLSIFSSTTLNFMFSRDPLFSLFLFSLFRCLLNSFFSVCGSPLSPNRVPHFLMVIFLYSLFSI